MITIDNKAKVKLFITLFLLNFIFATVSTNLFFESLKRNNIVINHEAVNEIPKLSKSWGKIYIYQDNWTGLPISIRSGSGTSSDPWLIKDLVIDAGGSGSSIHIEDSSDYFTIQNCTLINSGTEFVDAGIQLEYASNGLLTDNNISLNNAGIYLWGVNINVTNNNISDNIGYGIYIDGNSYIKINGNTIKNNDNSGIYVGHAVYGFEIIDNDIFNNTEGIKLSMCSWGVIKENQIKNNSLYGILADNIYDSPVYIYENYLIDNSVNAKEPYSYGLTYWNSSVIGNYWSNYTGSDKDDDGIGDTPFNFGTGIDYLPIWEDGNDLPEDFVLDSTADDPDPDGSFDLTWTVSTGADNYSVYTYDSFISEINISVTLVEEGITTLTHPISGLENGTYYYMALAFNKSGSKNSNCIEITVQLILPGEFVLDSTADDPDPDGSFDLTWTESTGADNYSVYTDDSFITQINGGQTLLGTIESLSFPISGLSNGTYFYKVLARNETGTKESNCIEVMVQIGNGDNGDNGDILEGNDDLGDLADSGGGTKPDPYVFENKRHDANGNGSALEIRHTNAYFIYNNSIFINSGSDSTDAGLKMINVTNGVFNNCTFVSNNGHGIYLSYVEDTNFTFNNLVFNSYNGIYSELGYNNYFIENVLINSSYNGIYVKRSYKNYLVDNNLVNSSFDGISLELSYNNTLFGNNVALSNYNGIYLVNCTNNTIHRNNIVNNSLKGIFLEDCNNTIIMENTAENNGDYGIYIDPSFQNIISDNIVKNNDYGIFLNSSNFNLITGNLANYNKYFGIFVLLSSNNSIAGNIVNENEFCGISLSNSSFSNITNNVITSNQLYGILLNNSNFNNIFTNTISDNSFGIVLDNSNFNSEFNNTYSNNQVDITQRQSQGNIIDYGSGGGELSMIIIISVFVLIGILSVGSLTGGVLTVRSRKKVKARDIEILSLKHLKEEITEDDIAVYKEKHFCVVHRGPIKGYNFICPDCGTYYCIKCLDAIKELENKCWSCESILDSDKPILEYKEEKLPKPIIEEESQGEEFEPPSISEEELQEEEFKTKQILEEDSQIKEFKPKSISEKDSRAKKFKLKPNSGENSQIKESKPKSISEKDSRAKKFKPKK